MTKNDQRQKVGDNSTSLQVGGDMYLGMTYSDVKELALDVFKNNFYQLSEEASNIALKRVETFTEKVIEKLQSEQTSLLDSMKDPDMQYVLYNSQTAYARSGDENLSEILIDLLVERANTTERALKQIVLNESLAVVPKLTDNQLNLLSLILLFYGARNPSMKSFEFLEYYIKIFVSPFINSLSVENSDFWHLEYASCGKVENGEARLHRIFLNKYPILLSKGFTLEEFEEKNLNNIASSDILIPCLHDKVKYQFDITKREELIENFGEINAVGFLELYDKSLMTETESDQFLRAFNRDLEKLMEFWDSSNMKSMSLTSVGIAIGNANIRRRTGRNIDLSIWIK